MLSHVIRYTFGKSHVDITLLHPLSHRGQVFLGRSISHERDYRVILGLPGGCFQCLYSTANDVHYSCIHNFGGLETQSSVTTGSDSNETLHSKQVP